MLDIVSLRLTFVQGICIEHMLQSLYPPQQIIVHHFFEPLMDDKNLTIGAQVAKALFVLQMLNSIQALIHQHY